jgi:hypothetical protein
LGLSFAQSLQHVRLLELNKLMMIGETNIRAAIVLDEQ